MSKKVGYARVSTVDQDTATQVQFLEDAGCTEIFHEQISGATTDRPQLQAALDYMREGDTFIVRSIDRLARSVIDLLEIVETLKEAGIHFKVLTLPIDLTGALGKVFLVILGVFAEFERAMINERQAIGIARVQDEVDKGLRTWNGRGPSRKVKEIDWKAVRDKIDLGVPRARICRDLGIGESTLRRGLNK